MYEENIGKKVSKSVFRVGKSPKPFKSGSKVNTVKGVVVSPITGKESYTFEEDDSFVHCEICEVVG